MLYLAVVTFIWAISFGLIGSSLKGVDPFLVATLRLACATLLFLPFIRSKKVGARNCVTLMIFGAIQFGLMYTFYMKSYEYIPSHLVAIFSILTPLYVVLIHDLQTHKFSKHYFIAALLSVIGAAIIRVKGVPLEDIWIGFGLMQLAGIAFAFGQVSYLKWKLQNPTVRDFEVFGLLALGGALSAFAFSFLLTNWQTVEITTNQWACILYLGIVASGIGFYLWNKGAALCNAGTLAAFNNALIPVAVLSSLFIFGEIKEASLQNVLRLGIGTLFVTSAIVYGMRSVPKAPSGDTSSQKF